MSNEKNIFISFVFGVIFTSIAFTTAIIRNNIRQSKLNREQNERLAEQYQSIRSELDTVRSRLKQSREYVEQSRSDINEIEDAIGRIRKETQILQDYYDSTNNLCSD